MKSVPKDTKLYNRIKSQAKRKFKVYPSAYANAWVVKKYKKSKGKYSGKRTGKSGVNKSIKKIKRSRH